GVVEFECFPGIEDEPTDDRLRGLQKELGLRSGFENAAGFSVTLRSRAILLDDYLRFRSQLEVADLVEAASLSCPPEEASAFRKTLRGFKPAAHFIHTDPVYGWNGSSGMPRSPDIAVRAGASFLFVRQDQPLAASEIAVLASGFEAVE